MAHQAPLPQRDHRQRSGFEPGVRIADPGPPDERRVMTDDMLRVVVPREPAPLLPEHPVAGPPKGGRAAADRVPEDHSIGRRPARGWLALGEAERSIGILNRDEPVGRFLHLAIIRTARCPLGEKGKAGQDRRLDARLRPCPVAPPARGATQGEQLAPGVAPPFVGDLVHNALNTRR